MDKKETLSKNHLNHKPIVLKDTEFDNFIIKCENAPNPNNSLREAVMDKKTDDLREQIARIIVGKPQKLIKDDGNLIDDPLDTFDIDYAKEGKVKQILSLTNAYKKQVIDKIHSILTNGKSEHEQIMEFITLDAELQYKEFNQSETMKEL